MAQPKPDSRSNIFPFMRYKDAPAAIAWLAKAFGFTEHAVYPGPNGTIAHATAYFSGRPALPRSASWRSRMLGSR
jgi:uncharacterized glyoxalase superfamily protein PhnB